MENDFGTLHKPFGLKQSHISTKPLGISNCVSSFDRKSGFYGCLPKSSPIGNVRKTLFENKNKENDESTLCKDFSNREATGKTPIVVSRQRNESNSDETHAGRMIKPRRSMLGQRSKSFRPSISKDDSSYTISQPLHSSSPLNVDYRRDNFTDMRLKKTTSTPTLNHPFDSQDADASSFFSKGLSDSTWSVFKSNKKAQNSEGTPLRRRMPIGKSNAPLNKPTTFMLTDDQRMKLEYLALKFSEDEPLSNNSLKEQKRYLIGKPQESKGCTQSNILGARTRAQLKRQKEKFLSEAISPISNPNPSCVPEEDEANDLISTPEKNDSSQGSADSYIHNEATIVGTCIKKLDDIHEESLTNINISNTVDKNPEGSDEFESQKDLSVNYNLNSILNLFQDLKKEKKEIDNKLSDLLQQKQSFDKKWNELNCAIISYSKGTGDSIRKSSVEKPRHNKVISTKARRSFGMSPKVCLSLSKSKTHTSNNYSDLKANFSCLKTPVQSVKDIRRFRKSACYTPNSLSVLVGDQVKDIFGDM